MAKVFIHVDQGGKIDGVGVKSSFYTVERDALDPEVVAFINPPKSRHQRISEELADTETPQKLARKLEDIIDHIANDTPLDQTVSEWASDRRTRRGSID